MAEILLEKLEDALHPVDEDSINAMRQIPERTIVKVKVSIPRNIRQHRLFFALIKLMWVHQLEPRQFPTEDSLRAAVLIAIGHVIEVRCYDGTTRFIPDSIAFGRMDNIAFQQLLDSAIHFITTFLLPGMGNRDLEQQVADMLRLPGPAQLERN
jgi:hypothetical protein